MRGSELGEAISRKLSNGKGCLSAWRFQGPKRVRICDNDKHTRLVVKLAPPTITFGALHILQNGSPSLLLLSQPPGVSAKRLRAFCGLRVFFSPRLGLPTKSIQSGLEKGGGTGSWLMG
jgi:hypothetical protein